MIKRVVVVLILALAFAAPAAAQRTIVLVRHAERADAGSTGSTDSTSSPRASSPRAGMASPPAGADPDLSPEGRTRASSLARVLADVKITQIFTTELKRTQQTAAPLAQVLKLSVTTVPAANTPALIDQIKLAPGNVLVVGHSNTLPEIMKRLGVQTPVTIADDQFDDLFVVTTVATLGPPPTLVHLHYR